MKRALVTGATGYVGSNLVKGLIQAGWIVGIIVRPSSSMEMILEIGDKIDIYETKGTADSMLDIVGKAKPDVVFHVASLVINEHQSNEVAALISSNITFGTQLLEAMAFHGVTRFVNTGTHWEHYENKDYSPVNLYAATKRAFQDLLLFYLENRGVKSITLTLFDPYGPNDHRPKLLNLLMKVAKTGAVLSMSPGEQKIDLVHIKDVVNAYEVAAGMLMDDKVKSNETYGVASGKPISLKDLVATIECQIGIEINILWGGKPYRNREMMIDYDRYKKLPGWSPAIALKSGVWSLDFSSEKR